MSNAVICSTCDELVVPPNESAKLIRVYYSMLTIAGVVVHLVVMQILQIFLKVIVQKPIKRLKKIVCHQISISCWKL